MTRLVGYQPQYFPRLHYFARILNSDIYTISDNLQYVRKHVYLKEDGTRERGVSYQAHTPIKTAQGIFMLDIPVFHGGTGGRQLLTEARIDNTAPWQEKHLKNIEHHYKKAPEFDRVFPSLQMLFSARFRNLAALTVASTMWGLAVLCEAPLHAVESCSPSAIAERLPHRAFRLRKIIRMSESDVPPPDKEKGYDASQWIIDKCKKFGADEYYYGGTAAAAYAEFDRMRDAGINVLQQEWRVEEYPQQFPKTPFIPNLSIIDLLMNVPPEDARRILQTPNQ